MERSLFFVDAILDFSWLHLLALTHKSTLLILMAGGAKTDHLQGRFSESTETSGTLCRDQQRGTGMSQGKPKEVANAFNPEFLLLAEELGEPATAAEAELAGPWKVLEVADRFAVLRAWEEPEKGDKPWAVFMDREIAERMAAILPSLAAPPAWRVVSRNDVDGFALLGPGGETLGYLQHSNPELLGALSVADHLARSPRALAALLMTAGARALRHVGALVARELRVRARSAERKGSSAARPC
jgi:hypothetical protein